MTSQIGPDDTRADQFEGAETAFLNARRGIGWPDGGRLRDPADGVAAISIWLANLAFGPEIVDLD